MNLRKRLNNTNTKNLITDLEKETFELKKEKFNKDINLIGKIKDYKLPPLHKKYFRPYFSPKFDSWEMDFLIVPFEFGKYPFKIHENSFFYYLFVININTKYLVVTPTFKKDSKIVMWLLGDMINNKQLDITNIRGDDDRAFNNNDCKKWLINNSISYYFTPNIYTNRNRVVDRVMRTIRDMFDQIGHKATLFDVDLMKKVVDKYNHTTHSAFNYRFTPAQVQNNKQLERIFIMNKKSRLEEIPKVPFNKYKYNDLLIVHIPDKNSIINNKRRRNFSHLAKFLGFIYGNVECEIIAPEDSYLNKKLILPIYYTKPFGSKLNDKERDYFNIDI
jgi:hypothetical protein